jgi:hypothetical protein
MNRTDQDGKGEQMTAGSPPHTARTTAARVAVTALARNTRLAIVNCVTQR